MARARLVFTVLLLPLLLGATPALAHTIKVFAAAAGERIEGRVYFAGGGPARNVAVQAESRDGRLLGSTRSDDDGRFALAVRERIDHVIVADSGDGHVARTTIAAASLSAGLPSGLPGSPPETGAATVSVAPGTAAPLPPGWEDRIAAAIAAQITPLREQLADHEDQVRLRDILGGLGYILGLAGLALWLKAPRRQETRR